MKKIVMMLFCGATGLSLGWTEEPAPAQNLSSYLSQLQIKLEHTAKRANQPTSSGSNVVGLRGSKQDPASKQLYWKGKTAEATVTPEEVKIFRTAIEQAQAGQKDQATGTLKMFREKYLHSPLKGEVEDTLKLLASA